MSSHPSDERLIAYANDELRGDDATAIADHVIGCTGCAGTVARFRMVRDFLRSDAQYAPPAALISRTKALFTKPEEAPARDFLAPLRRIIADLVFDSGGGLTPALAGFRGTGERHRTFEAGSIEIDLQTSPVATDEVWRILGQIASDRDREPASLAFVPDGSDSAVVTVTSDENGMFQAQLPAGTYELAIRFPDLEIIVPRLEMS